MGTVRTAARALLGTCALGFPLGLPGPAVAEQAHVRDVGIFSDLDGDVRISLPRGLAPSDVRLVIDARHRLLLLQAQAVALKAYPLCGAATTPGTGNAVALSFDCLTPADSAELRALVSADTPIETRGRAPDNDGDGIPDALDVLLGARKLVANAAAYTEGYYRIGYPRGDVPRSVGVCSDTIVRAFRNAGIDLQVRLAEDIRADRAAYVGITRPDPNIDHRRVKNLLRWFLRHVAQVRDGPHQPGDVVFLDTFPSRPGPDHVGIISDRSAPSKLPFVINNWTVGSHDNEMDLLPSIAVTHRFRMK